MPNQTAHSMQTIKAAMRYGVICVALVLCVFVRSGISNAQTSPQITIPNMYTAIATVTLTMGTTQPALEPPTDPFPTITVVAVLAGVFLLSQLLLAVVLVGLRRTLKQSVYRQDAQVSLERTRDLSAMLQLPQGWQTIAEKLMADALHENIALATDRGILDVETERSLRFTLMTRDGRTVTFTTNPKLMKKIKLIRRGDMVVNISKLSATNHAEVGILWQAILAQRSIPRVTPPTTTPWYVVVRDTSQRNGSGRGGHR
jgi:hypothetical protein